MQFAWLFKMALIGRIETSVTSYQSTLRKLPEERRSHLKRGGSLKSGVFIFCN
jgi:hypothetical protein